MNNSTIYNNNFLNSLFTTKEFEFINHMDSDVQRIDSMLEKEESYRDIIVTFINNLNEMIKNNNIPDDSESFSNLLTDVQNIFELTNKNIKTLQTSREVSGEINKQIVDLLIKIDSEGDNISETKFYSEISDVKENISGFSSYLESSKSELMLNDIKIENFLNQNIVKKYLSSFSIDIETKEDDINVHPSVNKKFNIPENMKEDNDTLVVSEKARRVYLPYSKKEVFEYLEQYPDQYRSFADVVKQEFIFPIDSYLKHPAIARFRETYTLIRDRESKSIVEAFKCAMDIMFHYDLNPAIIAACKSQDQLDNYLECLSRKKLDEFTDFKIKFELAPLKTAKKFG